MFTHIRPALASAIAVPTLVVLLAASVAAAGPWEEFQDHGECGGGVSFDADLMVKSTEQEFPGRIVMHTVIRGAAISNTGIVVRFLHSWTTELDFDAGTVTLTGVAFGAWVEGTDIRRIDRGRLVLDMATGEPIFIAGSWPPGPFDPVDATCELIHAAA